MPETRFIKKAIRLAGLVLACGKLIGWLPAQTRPLSQAAVQNYLLLSIEGTVEILSAGATNWISGKANQVLLPGDRVRTGPKSRASVQQSNLSVYRMAQLSDIEIPSTRAQRLILKQNAGKLYFLNRGPPIDLEIHTPIANAGIRGTEFNLEVDPSGQTTLTMIEGTVELWNELGQIKLGPQEEGKVETGKPPSRRPVIDVTSVIQWCLYYPGVLDTHDITLSPEETRVLSDSLLAYERGDLLAALANYPGGRAPSSNFERIYYAALLLSVGQVEETAAQLQALDKPGASSESQRRLADALREVIATVKSQIWNRLTTSELPTEWLAESYSHQSRFHLVQALRSARRAVEKSPNFGFGWTRVAELEFSFGRSPEALSALEKGLTLSPRNAQAIALKGFLLAAQNKFSEAIISFEEAMALDGGLGNAWLGRGLCRIRNGEAEAGRADLQVAALLEPRRALLRSYLGKAFMNIGDNQHANLELDLAKSLDAKDPTAWLYSALVKQQENRTVEAVRDLEQSQSLNDQRRLFRSRLLLDQDQAVRSANLATIYQDAGMVDLSVREAARAVNYDYANHSAHLFLANSYDALRDPHQVTLRYETPWFSELLLANLLSPVGAGSLSQYISQQEYSKMFESDRFGVSSSTEYLSRGAWLQTASQFGTLGNFSYALDGAYRSDNGQRPNNDLKQWTFSAKIKQQITRQDSVFVQVLSSDFESGDVLQYYDPASASRSLRIKESQKPNLFVGYHHEWSPGIHTLFLGGRLQDDFRLSQEDDLVPVLTRDSTAGNQITAVTLLPFRTRYSSELEAYTAELQQIWQGESLLTIVGGRYQTGESTTTSLLRLPEESDPFIRLNFNDPAADQTIRSDLQRASIYAYQQWQPLECLRLSWGLSYDHLDFPANIDIRPITGNQRSEDQFSPKAGFILRPLKNTHLRGSYTRSLGGLFYDTSIRLEPTQVAGFTQAYRSLIPESVVGLVPGSRFETWALGLDHRWRKDTYFGIEGEILRSEADRRVGVFDFTIPPALPSNTQEKLNYEEKNLTFTFNQLLGREWSVGLRYRVSQAELEDRFPEIPANVNASAHQNLQATLHSLNPFVIYNHASGLFSQVESLWFGQSNRGYSPDLPGDDFWQFNAFVGYHFARRRAKALIGVLNINNQDYRLNPLNVYAELPRERTLVVRFQFYF